MARILHWGGGHRSWAPKGRESKRQRRREGWGLGRGCPPHRLGDLGNVVRSPVGPGTEPRPPTHSWHILGPQITSGGENSPNKAGFFRSNPVNRRWVYASPSPLWIRSWIVTRMQDLASKFSKIFGGGWYSYSSGIQVLTNWPSTAVSVSDAALLKTRSLAAELAGTVKIFRPIWAKIGLGHET